MCRQRKSRCLSTLHFLMNPFREEAAGTDFSKVVKTTCFLAHISDFAAFNAVYEKYFLSKPARSCFEVSALPKGALVEIEAVAVIE